MVLVSYGGSYRTSVETALVKPFQQGEGRGLADQKIIILGVQLRLARGDADGTDQPHPHDVINKVGLVFGQREGFGKGRNQHPQRGIKIGRVQQGIGQRNRQFVDRPAMAHVAKVDQTRDSCWIGGVDNDVPVIGVLMQDRGTQSRQARQYLRLIAGEEPLDQRAAGGVSDVGAVVAKLDHVVQRPWEVGAKGLRVTKALHRPGQPAHEGPKRGKLVQTARGFRQGLAVDPCHKPHQAGLVCNHDRRAVLAVKRWHDTGDAGLPDAGKMQHRRVLQVDLAGVFRRIGNLQDEFGARCNQSGILVAFRWQRAKLA